MAHEPLAQVAACALLATSPLPADEPPVHPPVKPSGTTVQLPTLGVAIDAAGTLVVRSFGHDAQRLHQRRMAAAQPAVAGDVLRRSAMRCISLKRLDAAIQAARDGELDETVLNLAGLQRLQFVFCLPADEDIVIAGPAAGWRSDASGRVVGAENGWPVIQLRDLAVAFRQFLPGQRSRPFIGCTINPSAGALQRLQRFQRTFPRTIPESARAEVARQIVVGTETALGMADVHVFGISPATQMAAILVEADYRMKRIAIGLEPPPVPLTTFLDAMRRPPDGIQRWWFTPDDECLHRTPDGLSIELVSKRVRLQTENLVQGPQGAVLNAELKPSRAARTYATMFTEKYPQIAARSPVFAAMQNMIDLLVAAAYCQAEDLYGQASWTPVGLLDESQLTTESCPPPRRAPCAANAVWKGARLIAPAGGGVSISPHQAVDPDHQQIRIEIDTVRQRVNPPQATTWWWDAP